MSWSAQQCRLLDALGYECLEPGRPTAAGVAQAPASSAAAPVPRSAPASGARTAPAFPPRAAPQPAASGSTVRLMEAVRRAANGADPSALVDDPERLRRDPALKRALWPRLRALRRSHP